MNKNECQAKDPRTCRYHGVKTKRSLSSYIEQLKERVNLNVKPETFESDSGNTFRTPESYSHKDTVPSMSKAELQSEANFDKKLAAQEFEAGISNKNNLNQIMADLRSPVGQELLERQEQLRDGAPFTEASLEVRTLRDNLDNRIAMEDYYGADRFRSTAYMGNSFESEAAYREWMKARTNTDGQYSPKTYIQASPYSHAAFSQAESNDGFEVVFEMSAANGLRSMNGTERNVILSKNCEFEIVKETPLTITGPCGDRKVLLVQLDERMSDLRAKNTREYNNF